MHTIVTQEHRLRPSVMRRRVSRTVREKVALVQRESRRHPLRVATALGVAALTGVAVAATLHAGPHHDG